MPSLGRLLITLGLALTIAGLVVTLVPKLPLGRLPGDLVIERERATFYLPLGTCALLSVFLSLIVWLLNRFR